MSDYKKTLQLPQTKFPMKANLTQKEPEMLKFWEDLNAYSKMVSAGNAQGDYVLHDGPPYANGHIHLGTAMNKILKDIVVKSRNMQGYKAEYVPGWDCHGLPIEHKVAQELKGKDLPPIAIRKRCRDYATKFLGIQRKEFKRLGVMGVWEEPYMTMNPSYEAATARELGKFMDKGSVSRNKKPIYWCLDCQTALAEAEVEYYDHSSPSIYVRFPLPDPGIKDVFPGADPENTYIVIWTTTPWTLPSNMAVAVHEEFEYALVQTDDGQHIVANELLPRLKEKFGWEKADVLGTVPGAKLNGLKARHPFFDRDSLVVLADYVTLDAGTGCVHTAPGHGRDDYETGLKHGLEVLSPLNDEGRFLPEIDFLQGLTVWEANPKVVEKCQSLGRLLAQEKMSHSYPHCWRCKKPVIFRATTQWFITMEANDLRQKALKAIANDVRWIPAWGRERIHNMIEFRPDWCISRQRNWGVPIVALLCEDCDQAWFGTDWVMDIVDRFAKHERGCDYWFEADLAEIVPQDLTCPKCGAAKWKRETDILDVWFDSGTSYAAVVEQRPECRFPADMYLEGSDQHRGWFHSSLLASVGTRGEPPYRAVLTHGYVVDGEGKKMSKSIGNVVAPQEIIDKYGAEILRMWVSSVDYQEDVRISEEILSRLVDAYRRIRNTCRYLLGNLSDFSPEDALPVDKMLPLDRYALDMCAKVHERVQAAYTEFEYHKVFHSLHQLCVTELSAFYLDIIKDRLYVSGAKSLERRSAQTALWRILTDLITDMAPVLSFTAEECLKYLPEALKPGVETVFEMQTRTGGDRAMDQAETELWDQVAAIRSEVTKTMEPLRKSGEIGHSLSARITLYTDGPVTEAVQAVGPDTLREVFIVSEVVAAPMSEAPVDLSACEGLADLKVAVTPAEGEKCERCWIVSRELGTDSEHPALCPRCTNVMKEA